MWVINGSNHSISLAANGISFLLLFLSLIYICRQFRKSFLDKSVQLQCFEIEKGLLIIKGDRDIICNREPPAASFLLSENDGKRLAPLFMSTLKRFRASTMSLKKAFHLRRPNQRLLELFKVLP